VFFIENPRFFTHVYLHKMILIETLELSEIIEAPVNKFYQKGKAPAPPPSHGLQR
jgi:hypothetical protein